MKRAKGILQRDLQLSEEDAYLTLQKQSRQRRESLREVAEAIVLNQARPIQARNRLVANGEMQQPIRLLYDWPIVSLPLEAPGAHSNRIKVTTLRALATLPAGPTRRSWNEPGAAAKVVFL